MKKKYSLYERLSKIKKSGINNLRKEKLNDDNDTGLLCDRINAILQLLENYKKTKNTNNMLCFIMYDIEDNKIRNHIAKFLIKKGCLRVQKSVFVGNIERKIFTEISESLKDVNEMYDNEDSILILPISEEFYNNMRVIGKNIDFKIVLQIDNLLFI